MTTATITSATVVAFPTVGGATATVTFHSDTYIGTYTVACTGCGWRQDSEYVIDDDTGDNAMADAADHAGYCQELPE